MDNRINQNRITKTQFNGIKNPVEVKNVKKIIKEIVNDTIERAEREVAEYGSFTYSVKKFKNPDTNLVADKFWIEIEQPPKGIEDYQKNRGVYFHAQKKGIGTDEGPSVHILLEYGTKAEIMEKIKGEEFAQKLVEQTKNLSYHLQDL